MLKKLPAQMGPSPWSIMLSNKVSAGFSFTLQAWHSGRNDLWDGITRRQYFLMCFCCAWCQLLSDSVNCGELCQASPSWNEAKQAVAGLFFFASSLMLVLASLLSLREVTTTGSDPCLWLYCWQCMCADNRKSNAFLPVCNNPLLL